jgi:hypothetical protein
MTPEEIKKHFGAEALDMLYDCVLQNPVHELADWILTFYSDEEVGKWINELKADQEETE